jgi:hypothetical protein
MELLVFYRKFDSFMEHSEKNYFEEIRDIPYRIQLTADEPDLSCTGKNLMLLEKLQKLGYEVRWRVCTFKWSSIELPTYVTDAPHEDDSSHAYLELRVADQWRVIDATWDRWLSKIFPVNEWGLALDHVIAVDAIKTYDPNESTVIMASITREIIEEDLHHNGKFYKAFNHYLEEIRLNSGVE